MRAGLAHQSEHHPCIFACDAFLLTTFRCQQEPLQMPLGIHPSMPLSTRPSMPLSIHPPDAHWHPLRRVTTSMAYLRLWPVRTHAFTHNLQQLYSPTPPNVTLSIASRLYTRYENGDSSNLLPGAKTSRVRVFLTSDRATPNQSPSRLGIRRECSIWRATAS